MKYAAVLHVSRTASCFPVVVVTDGLWLLQLVTSVPTDMLPSRLALRPAADKQEIELNERQPEPEEETVEDLTPRGQILWIRGLTRLQHQVDIRRSVLVHAAVTVGGSGAEILDHVSECGVRFIPGV